MTPTPPPAPLTLALEYLAAPRFAHALTIAIIGTAVLSAALERTIGWAGLIGILAALVLLSGLALFAQRDAIKWFGVLPISLLVFLGWAGLSLIWSQYQWSTLAGLAYLAAFTVLGLFVALTRDTIQIVRSFGDVLRVVLVASLALEILSGVLIDAPIRFLGIEGNLPELGPIQGLMETRNQLGFVAVIAAITFGTEFRTKSVSRGLGIGSMILAGVCLLLARSPVTTAVVIVVAAAAAALYAIRRVRKDRRTFWQLILLLGVVISLGIAWAARGPLVAIFNAGGELDYRLALWRRVLGVVNLHLLEGWGWLGPWRPDVQPFPLFANPDGRVPSTALNAFLDVWFQLGLVGLVIFVGLVGLALVRSWLLAGRKKSFVFAWPALVLVALIVTSLAESTILAGAGWLLFVVCCVKSARELSWRKAFEAPLLPSVSDR